VLQVIAAVLLLIPGTVALGAVLYFPIILNIFVLSYAVRFEGSILTSPLMVLGCLFLVLWHYDKIKYLLPLKHEKTPVDISHQQPLSNKFPVKFFLGCFAAVAVIVLFIRFGFDVMPRNSFKDCSVEFVGTNRTQAGAAFCDCIHNQGKPLDTCLKKYYDAPDDVLPEK
jgi:hypothetical protein